MWPDSVNTTIAHPFIVYGHWKELCGSHISFPPSDMKQATYVQPMFSYPISSAPTHIEQRLLVAQNTALLLPVLCEVKGITYLQGQSFVADCFV